MTDHMPGMAALFRKAAEIEAKAMPIPFPGDGTAKVLPEGGWIARRGKVVRVSEPIDSGESGCCGALHRSSTYVCSRGLHEGDRWHIAATSDRSVVAVWPAEVVDGTGETP